MFSSLRRSEWYSYHFPELVKIVNDNLLFAKLVHLIKRRNNINEELYVASPPLPLVSQIHSLPQIEDITMDSTKTQQILEASKISMGMLIGCDQSASYLHIMD